MIHLERECDCRVGWACLMQRSDGHLNRLPPALLRRSNCANEAYLLKIVCEQSLQPTLLQ